MKAPEMPLRGGLSRMPSAMARWLRSALAATEGR